MMPSTSEARRGTGNDRTPLLDPALGDRLAKHSTITTTADEENTILENASTVETETALSTTSNVPPILIIGVLLIGVFVANAEGSLVLATYGRISSDFDDLENASWLVTSYMLAMSAAQPLYGKLSDIFGRAHMILTAYLFFAVGCAMCAAGKSLPAVVAGRVVSGIGGGGMGSLVSILITDLVPLREVGSWRSYVGMVATAGRGLGGPIGGYLADTIGWRWSFLGQCPPTVLAMLLTWYIIPNHSYISGKETLRAKLGRVDFLGAFVLVSTISVFLLPLELVAELSWANPLILGFLGCSVGLFVLFILIEAHWAKEPILVPHLLVSSNILVPNIITFCQAAAQLGMMYTVPIYFQVTQDASSTVAGAHLFPAVLGVAAAGLFGGYTTKRTGKYKTLLIAATLCSTASYTLLVLFWGTDINFWESLYIVPGGVGNGLVLSAAFVALTAKVEKEHIAMVCSSFYLSANTGTVIGLAVTNAVLQGTLKRDLGNALRDDKNKDLIVRGALSSIEYIQGLDEPTKGVVVEVYTQGLRYAHGSNVAFASIAFVASLVLREYPIES